VTEDLQRAIFRAAHASEDREDFYATLIAMIGVFAAEHLGTDKAIELMLLGAESVDIDDPMQ
jgi:hypothetical protein